MISGQPVEEQLAETGVIFGQVVDLDRFGGIGRRANFTRQAVQIRDAAGLEGEGDVIVERVDALQAH
jgi:hypothetical protein